MVVDESEPCLQNGQGGTRDGGFVDGTILVSTQVGSIRSRRNDECHFRRLDAVVVVHPRTIFTPYRPVWSLDDVV